VPRRKRITDAEASELEARVMDVEANAFAMELLMPADWLRADIAELGGIDIEDDKVISDLAKRYGVSRQIMTRRIVELETE
jgi:Zn-dependent peptidase ImmA (M78 family)